MAKMINGVTTVNSLGFCLGKYLMTPFPSFNFYHTRKRNTVRIAITHLRLCQVGAIVHRSCRYGYTEPAIFLRTSHGQKTTLVDLGYSHLLCQYNRGTFAYQFHTTYSRADGIVGKMSLEDCAGRVD